MEQNQERKHFCKLCQKSFSSGKVLGGHMRCHRNQDSTKSVKKRKKIPKTNGEPGYSLRENPKKSWKISAPKPPNNGETHQQQENLCKICGKGFDSSKALFGHMRHHSVKRKDVVIRCKECDNQEFESLKSLDSHMKIHTESRQKLILDGQSDNEAIGLVRKKRSNRTRCKLISNLSSSSSSSFDEIEPEIEELAVCLLMLSRGVGNIENEFSFETDPLYQTQRLLNDDDGCYASDSSKLKLNSAIGFEDYDHSGFRNVVEDKVKLEFPVHGYYGEIDSQMLKLNDESEMVLFCDSESQIVCNKPNKKPRFESFDLRKEDSNTSLMMAMADGHEIIETDENVENSKVGHHHHHHHQCAICLKIFASGQALGGHKRAHVIRTTDKAELVAMEISNDACNETNGDHVVGFESWWDGDDHELKHGELVALISN